MNILLVAPPLNTEVPAKSTLLGLGYLSATLRKNGHVVKIIDFTLANTVLVAPKDIDCIGVTAMFTMNKKATHNFLHDLQKIYPNSHIIVGGAHASTFPEEMIEYADTVVVGEGEEIICDVVENQRKGIIRAERIRDLDKLPFPAWDLLADDMNEINRLSAKSPFLMRRPLVHIITSRGCPNNCVFCAVKVAWGKQWIPRSAKNVVDEIEYLVKLGFKEIHFNDDNCSISKERMYEICKLIRQRNIDIRIACPTGIHIATLDYPLLNEMKRAGFYRLCFGIETGNQEMQKKIKKNIDLDKARKVIREANKLGYWTSATFIFGFPDETEQQRRDTIEFAKTSGIDFPIFYELQIQPKTELWNLTHITESSLNTN